MRAHSFSGSTEVGSWLSLRWGLRLKRESEAAVSKCRVGEGRVSDQDMRGRGEEAGRSAVVGEGPECGTWKPVLQAMSNRGFQICPMAARNTGQKTKVTFFML